MKESLEQYAGNRLPRMKQTLEELVLIPAPSLSERARADYCLQWLDSNGVTGAYIDDCDNVIVSYPAAGEVPQKQT